MKRAEIQTQRGPLTIQTYDKIPDPPRKGLIVKVTFCGICHSDLNNWQMWKWRFPAVHGHEVAGEVYSLGEDVGSTDLKIGDNVMVYPWVGCGGCEECSAGRDLQCPDRSQVVGCSIEGGYSNYQIVREVKFVLKVPSSIPMDIACMLPCSGLTTYSAVKKVIPYLEDTLGARSVLIIGAGGLGLWCLQWCKFCLPKGTKVVVADLNKASLDIALQHGADDILLWPNPEPGKPSVTEDLLETVKQKSDNGFNAVIDLVATSVTAERGYAALARGGTQVIVGMFGGSTTFELKTFVWGMKRVLSSYVGSLQELHELREIATKNKVKPPPITHFALDDVPKAWEKLFAGQLRGRGIIKHDH